MKPWVYVIAVLALIAAFGGAYAFGRSDGAAIEQAAQARATAAVEAERKLRGDRVDAIGAGTAQLEQNRAAEVRNIYVEVPKYIDRPVYRSVCVDGDGLRSLDAAAAAANGADPGQRPAGAGGGAPAPADS